MSMSLVSLLCSTKPVTALFDRPRGKRYRQYDNPTDTSVNRLALLLREKEIDQLVLARDGRLNMTYFIYH